MSERAKAHVFTLLPHVLLDGTDNQYVLCFCRAPSAFTCFVSCLQTLRRAIDEVRHEMSYMPSFSCIVFSAVSHDLYVRLILVDACEPARLSQVRTLHACWQA
jgi:hypothetical protein